MTKERDIDAVLEAMSKQFMVPVVTGKTHWYAMDGSAGIEYIQCTYAGVASDVDEPETFAVHYSGTIESVERVIGYGARLSAPGYMDCTDWTVLPTEDEAKEYLVETYGDDVELDDDDEN